MLFSHFLKSDLNPTRYLKALELAIRNKCLELLKLRNVPLNAIYLCAKFPLNTSTECKVIQADVIITGP